MPGMGSSKRQKPRTITRGFCLMSAGTTHLDPQGWALRAVHSHNPHGKVLVPEHCRPVRRCRKLVTATSIKVAWQVVLSTLAASSFSLSLNEKARLRRATGLLITIRYRR